MATQGIVSILDADGKMLFKAIAGSDGYNALKLVEWVKAQSRVLTIEDVYEAAKRVQFGGQDDLVVQDSTGSLCFHGDGGPDGLGGLYRDRVKFYVPHFNPRWERGTADYVEIVTLANGQVLQAGDAKQPAAARFPSRRFYGQSMQTTLGLMLSMRETQNRILDEDKYTGRRVLGYKLPEWQRPEVWADDQCIRFLESVWLGVGIGSFMVNHSTRADDAHMILLDGQQRLRAIERYWDGELAVTGDDGVARCWRELTEKEQAHFLRIPFPWVETSYSDDAQLREAYNRHNFGGTSHTLEQRAKQGQSCPRISKPR